MASGFSLNAQAWNFGDPASGSNNTSFLANPTHAFSSPGNYTVQLVLYYSCGAANDTLSQVVNITSPCVTFNTHTITCANLGSATVTPVTGLGPYTYTWLPVAQTGSTATGLVPGSYTVLVHDPVNNTNHTVTTAFAPVVPLTGNSQFDPSAKCFGTNSASASVVNLSGGSGNQYYSWTNGTNSFTNAAPMLGAGLWTVTVLDALTSCSITDVFFISQPPAATVLFSKNSPTACANTSVIITATASGGTPPFNFSWVNGPATSSIAVSEAGGTYVYSLITTDSNSCAVTHTTSFAFTPNPTLSVASVSVCPLEMGTLSVSGASTYTWSNNTSGTTLIDSPNSTAVYSVTGSAQSCTASATASITVKPLPNVVAGTNGPQCVNGSVVLYAGGGGTYGWTGPLNFTSSSAAHTFTTVSLSQAGVYQVTVTALNSCTAAASTTVVVNPTPSLTATGATLCSVDTKTLVASSVNGATFLWAGPLLFSSNQQNAVLSNPGLNAGGNYSVTATSPQGCTNATFVPVQVVSPPNLNVTLSQPSLCAQAFNGSPNTITLTSTGANTYTLLTGAPVLNSDPTNSTAPLSVNPPFMPTGLATATLLGSNGVCTVSTTASFSIIPNPSVTATTPTPVICAGKTLTYTSNGADSYVWTSSTPNFTTYNNGGVAVAHPSLLSVFSVYGSSLGCQSALFTASINVNPIPTVFVAATKTAVCLYTGTTLKASGTAQDFYWLPLTSLSNSTGAAVEATPLTNQVYTVIGSALGCTNSATAKITVLALPKPKIILSKANLCVYDTLVLSGKGGKFYEWFGPADLHLSGSPVKYALTHQAFAGEYTVVATDSNGCKGNTTAMVGIDPLPNGYLTGLKDECVPFQGEYGFVAMNSSSLTADWKVYELKNGTLRAVKNLGQKEQVTFSYSVPGQYQLSGKLTDKVTGCISTQTFLVNAFEKPRADFSWDPEKPVEGLDDVHFTSTSKGLELMQWNWYFSDVPASNHSGEHISYVFQKQGTFPIAMVVENKWGCRDTTIKVLTVETDFAFYVPNAFTPNADSKNESFKPSVRGIKKYHFQVFNRWGERLFVTENPEEGWDGYHNGILAQQGVYVWKAVISTVSGDQKEYVGNVVLLK